MPDYQKIADSVEVPGEKIISPEEAFSAPRISLPLDDPKYRGIAEAKGYSQETGRIQRVHYSHEAMIDVILANPNIKQNELAATFDKSVPWISRIIGSDAFQAALAKRRDDLTDPFLVATIEERFRGLAFQSLDIIAEKLQLTQNSDLALKALDVSVKALGFGARGGGNNQTNQFVIQLPPKSANSEEWVEGVKRIGNG